MNKKEWSIFRWPDPEGTDITQSIQPQRTQADMQANPQSRALVERTKISASEGVICFLVFVPIVALSSQLGQLFEQKRRVETESNPVVATQRKSSEVQHCRNIVHEVSAPVGSTDTRCVSSELEL